MTRKKFRAGAIGRTGKGNYGHGLHLSYQGIDDVEFVSIADEDETGRKKAAEQTGALRTYADYREMLKNEDLDIVSVCPRWVDCHEDMILACVEAGCHIYCEKPLAMTPVSADRIVAASDRARCKIAVAHQGVYLPQIQAVKKLIAQGRIGTLQSMVACGKQDHRGGGEDMMVLGIHLFNMMRFFAGDPAWIFAHVSANGTDMTPKDVREAREPIGPIAGDGVISVLGFGNGVIGQFASRANQPGNGQGYGLILIGERGRIGMSGNTDSVAICNREVWAPWQGGYDWVPLNVPTASLHEAGNRLAIVDLINAVKNDREPLSSARDARWALDMIWGAYASQISGAREVLPLVNRDHPLEVFRRLGE